MKKSLSWLLAGSILLATPSCIYVRVTGDPGDEFWGDDDDRLGFQELSQAVDGCLADARYDLDLEANPLHTDAEWTVRFAEAGSDGPAAFHKAKDAVLARIARENGAVVSEKEEGPHVWSCSFRVDGEPGSASVRLVPNARADDDLPHALEVTWEQSD